MLYSSLVYCSYIDLGLHHRVRNVHVQVRGEVHHDRRLHVLMLREEEMQWEQGFSKPQYHTRWNSMLGEVHSSPTDSAGSLHAEYMNLPEAEEDQWAFFRSVHYCVPVCSAH